jgi:hypothetical protein
MALDDVPLADAGRDYYARQFDSRVRNIRKGGKLTARKSGRVNGWAAGVGVVAVLIGLRIVIALIVAASQSSGNDYNNYDDSQAAPVPFVNQPKPWEVAPNEAADDPADKQRLDEAIRRLLDDKLVPAAPDNEAKPPDKDD